MSLSSDLKRIAHTLCEGANTPRALAVSMMLEYGELGQLLLLKTDPSWYTRQTVDKYQRDNACTEFIRKLDSLVVEGVDKKARALELFWESEKQCCRTSARLKPFLTNGPFEDSRDERILDSIEHMQRWISNVLGPLPRELEVKFFGPGSTFEDVGRLTTVPDKMTSRPTFSGETDVLFPFWERTAWAHALYREHPNRSSPKRVRGNRFTTVPKDALKDRGICIEPSLNVNFQLAVGKRLRARLLRVGLDLKNGQDVHRRIARDASLSGSYATIDLSNASDTVSKTLVELLLAKSQGWLDLLRTVRSPSTLVGDKWVHLHKFSSMGNGFTFELETLIFAAISHEACRLSGSLPEDCGLTYWVYGDDLIVPTSSADTNLALLRYFGFTPNERKTFLKGGFRESCGGDFFWGVPVRAYYQKEEPYEPHQWISLANGLRRLGLQDFDCFGPWSFCWRAWLRALDALPTDIRRIRGPSSLGDLVIHDERRFWQSRQTPDYRRFARTWSPQRRVLGYHHWRPGVVLAVALLGGKQEGVSFRDSVYGYRKKWVEILEA